MSNLTNWYLPTVERLNHSFIVTNYCYIIPVMKQLTLKSDLHCNLYMYGWHLWKKMLKMVRSNLIPEFHFDLCWRSSFSGWLDELYVWWLIISLRSTWLLPYPVCGTHQKGLVSRMPVIFLKVFHYLLYLHAKKQPFPRPYSLMISHGLNSKHFAIRVTDNHQISHLVQMSTLRG